MAKRVYLEKLVSGPLAFNFAGDPYEVPEGKVLVSEAFKVRGTEDVHPQSADIAAFAFNKFHNALTQGDNGPVWVNQVRLVVEQDEPVDADGDKPKKKGKK